MFDVAVLGGGPAGVAAAIASARAGRSVALYAASSGGGFAVGETFPPAIDACLCRIGAAGDFEGCPKVESAGVISTWGSGVPQHQDYIFQPHGRGWHVDRAAFNGLLRDAAIRAGVRIVLGPAIARPVRERSAWRLPSIRAGFLIDASGRNSSVRFSDEPRRVPADNMLALVRLWNSETAVAPAQGWALVEPCAEGWCYSAPQPDGGWVTAFHADPDWFRAMRGDWDAAWRRLLDSHLPHMRQRLSGARPRSRWKVTTACSVRRGRFSGLGWIAAGDAACAWDPLSGAGVVRALHGGVTAAETICRAAAEIDEALRSYDAAQRSSFAQYLRARRSYYAAETRWPDAPFWRRRASAPDAQPAQVSSD